MSDHSLRWTSRILVGVALALVGTSAAIDVAVGRTFGELVRNFALFGYVMATTFPVVGAVIVHHRPRHAVGWIYLVIGTGMLSGLAHQYAEWGLQDPADPAPLAVLASWIGGWAWIVSIGLFMTFALLLFPDGRLPSRRWRPVAAGAAAGIVLTALDFAIGAWAIRGVGVVESGDASLASGVPDALAAGGSVLLFTTATLSVASLFVRWRRADTDQRQQIKWVVFGGAVAVTTMVSNILLTTKEDDSGTLAMIVAAPLIPAAMGIAIVRFRLYDFDLVLNRTVVFGLLASFITAVYVGIVVGVGVLTGSRADDPNVGLSLLATAVVAAAFQPARQRARRIANRLVYGRRATPYEVMADFSARMAETVSTEEVLPRMAEAAATGVGAGSVTVTVDLPTGGHRTATWPPGSDEGADADHTVAVEHQGERAGTIAVRMRPGERLDADGLDLLEHLATQAGVALRSVALNAELQARGDEIAALSDTIRASRQRIVVAQDAERRRMERDIHDGAQQQLVAMSVKMGLVGQLLERDPERALRLLDDLGADANLALEDLRDLARGIFPPLLNEQGLVAALDAHVRKHALPVSIVADPVAMVERAPQEVEVAAYFCCLEAIQNATKHAPGVPITVRLSRDGGGLTFVIHDEGPGFDPERAQQGTGLQNMSDRVAALGGTLTIESTPGAGTTVTGRIPAVVTAA